MARLAVHSAEHCALSAMTTLAADVRWCGSVYGAAASLYERTELAPQPRHMETRATEAHVGRTVDFGYGWTGTPERAHVLEAQPSGPLAVPAFCVP